MFKSDKRLWLTEDRETVVQDGDPRARILLVAEGGEIDDAEAKRYGLTDPKASKSAPSAEQAPAEDKAPPPPPADDEQGMKAQAPAEDKAVHQRRAAK